LILEAFHSDLQFSKL